MFVILCYDADCKRDAKLRKISKKYLTHIQRSVFEGFLTPSQLKHLKNDLYRYIVPDEDFAVIYTLNDEDAVMRCSIGKRRDSVEEDERNEADSYFPNA